MREGSLVVDAWGCLRVVGFLRCIIDSIELRWSVVNEKEERP
jgi:hypothetical protein